MAEGDDQGAGQMPPEILSNPFFGNLGPAALPEIEAELKRIELRKGAALFRAGDPGDSIYFLSLGMLEVSLPQAGGSALRLDVLDPGSMVGETALLTGQPRSATVSALVESEVLQLSRAGFDRLAAKYPSAMQNLFQQILPRIQRTQLAAVLAELFGPLETQVVHAFQHNVTWRHLPAGEVLMRKGDPGDAMYIVINGRLRMLDDSVPGAVRVLGDVARGETVGEFALLTGEPRSATVYAVRDSDVVCLTRAYMDQLIEAYPRLMLQMTRSIIRRSQAQLSARPAAANQTTAIVVAPTTSGLPVAAFIQQLVAQLSAAGKTLWLNSQRFDELFGRAGASQLPAGHAMNAVIDGWLTSMEGGQRYLVYETDAALSEWTGRCLRQGDRLLLLADSAAEPGPFLADPAFQNADLVLLQPDAAGRPSGTRRWLARFAPHALHHVGMGAAADFARLARRLTGRAVGLVLSGGGARGFAHLGAIRAIQEAGHPIDLIGGTSMGALIGAGYAMDWDMAQILELVRTFASPKKLLDYTLPYTSLVASNKASKILQDMFGEVQIEDLWRSYFCLSTNLTRAEPVIHETGSLWEAVRASTAIPGIFAPLLHDGDLLVDGGVMNNFPVNILRQRCEGGTLLGVNTSPKKEKVRNYHFGSGVSGWQVLWSKINPLAPKIRAPSILSSLMRATEASSIYRNTFLQEDVDVLILPQVGEYGSLDFAEYEKIIELGYQAGRATLASLNGSNNAHSSALNAASSKK